MKGWWSVCKTNGLPARYRRNVDTLHTMAKHCFSMVEYFRSADASFLLPYAIGKKFPLCFCISAAPSLQFDASVRKIKVLLWSGRRRMSLRTTLSRRVTNVFSFTSSHLEHLTNSRGAVNGFWVICKKSYFVVFLLSSNHITWFFENNSKAVDSTTKCSIRAGRNTDNSQLLRPKPASCDVWIKNYRCFRKICPPIATFGW